MTKKTSSPFTQTFDVRCGACGGVIRKGEQAVWRHEGTRSNKLVATDVAVHLMPCPVSAPASTPSGDVAPLTERATCLDCGRSDLGFLTRWTWWDKGRKRAIEPLCVDCYRKREEAHHG